MAGVEQAVAFTGRKLGGEKKKGGTDKFPSRPHDLTPFSSSDRYYQAKLASSTAGDRDGSTA